MKMHPIIPIPDNQAGTPIAFVEAVAMFADIPLPSAVESLVAGSTSEEPGEALLLLWLGTGVVQSFVFSQTACVWGRLPSAFWAWQVQRSGLERGIFQPPSSPLLEMGMGGTTAFAGSPIMVSQEQMMEVVKSLAIETAADATDDETVGRPLTTIATRKRCAAWLSEQFASDPDMKLSKAALWPIASEVFFDNNLSQRQFFKAWEEATVDCPQRRVAGAKKSTTH